MQRSSLIAIAVVLAAAGWLFLGPGGKGEAFEYGTDWNGALQQARETGKPILLNFGGPW